MQKIIQRTKGFEKAFRKLDQNCKKQFIKKLEQFIDDEYAIGLKTHRLKGKRKDEFAFSVTDDVRAIYRKIKFNNEQIIIFTFIDIGGHNKVY